MRLPILLPASLFLLFAWVQPARAHAVYLFAWVDGDRVCSEGYFAKKNKVRDGAVTVRNATGSLVAEGRTDEQGLWCFRAPAPQDLTFVLNAGQGHRAEFILPAKEFPSGRSPAADKETPATPETSSTEKVPAISPAQRSTAASLDDGSLRALVRDAVREELQSQLSPIRQALAEKNADPGPTLRDILGGLGWIIGLAGLAAWYTARRKP